jgi:aminopeptidase N
VGNNAFWEIIRGWAADKSGGNGTTEEFIAYAEDVSGQQLDDLFDTWLYTPEKPAASAVSPQGRARVSTAARARARAKHRSGHLHRRPTWPRY